MECPKCKAAIDDDSFYCDQCGSEIMMCPKCRAPRKGKRCTQCGSVLVPASSMGSAQTQQQAAQHQTQQTSTPQSPITEQDFHDAFQRAFHPQQSQAARQPQSAQAKPAAASRMVSMTAPGVAVTFVNDAVIGRTAGEYLNVFGADGYTSGRHAQLRLAPAGVWTITDLGSTNGTRVDGHSLIAGAPAALNIGSVVEIGSQKFRVE